MNQDPSERRFGRRGWGLSRPWAQCVLLVLVTVVIVAVVCRCWYPSLCCPESSAEDEEDTASTEPAVDTGPVEDVLRVAYTSPAFVALFDGKRNGGCVNDFPTKPAFGSTVGLGNMAGDCVGGRSEFVAVFAEDHQASFFDADWTDAIEERATPAVAANPPRTVPVRAWKAVNTDERDGGPGVTLTLAAFEAALGADIALTNDILNQNRAGLQLVLTEILELPGKDLSITGFMGTCDDIYAASPPQFESQLLQEGVLELIYVRDGGYEYARTCDYGDDGTAEGVIFLDFNSKLSYIPAHEVGHALGLLDPIGVAEVGHIDGKPGFSSNNLMWADIKPLDPEPDYLTLGQVYRMNVHSGSWHVARTGPAWATTCGSTADDDDPCPFLRQELDELP